VYHDRRRKHIHIPSVVLEWADTAQALAEDQEVKPLNGQGRPEKADNVSITPADREFGNSASYLGRRLKRDAPRVAEALARGWLAAPAGS
jgi:hypothetical protein